jgi:hypothetical protein
MDTGDRTFQLHNFTAVVVGLSHRLSPNLGACMNPEQTGIMAVS